MANSAETPTHDYSGFKRANSPKKRRIPGACDNCKKKKIRCDSAEMLGNRCSNCTQFSLECKHKEISKSLGSAKGYVESLEIRLEKMEKLLSKLKPGADLNYELDHVDETETLSELAELPRNDDDSPEADLIGRIKKLYVDPPQGRFFGKSSAYQLLQTALDIKRVPFDEQLFRGCKRPEFWPEFSSKPPWLSKRINVESFPPRYSFPDDDLLIYLVDAYFTQFNLFMPLLHRPSFEKSVTEGLHHRDRSFGSTLLLVCALGSRYSEDPRVCYPGSNLPLSKGWKWFEQVTLEESFISDASLIELQNYALSILFSQTTETAQKCWVQVGIALRRAQEVGAHRRRALKAPTTEDELWKRAFWVLMVHDRLTSSFSGHQCVLQEENCDVDLPIECDDEYWDHPDPALRFRQPEGRPSNIAFFNCYIKLMNILSYAMRVVYSIRKPTHSFGQGTGSPDQRMIIELDSAMNSWMDSVPDHLRWDPNSREKLFQKQSATLYAMYYHLQIFIHRPFIPSFRNPTPTTFPSLAICTNAARSCCHVLDIQSSRNDLPLPYTQIAVFASALVLILNIWSGKKSGYAPHPQREIQDVQKSMNLLKACESRWVAAGRYWDVLKALASARDLTLSLGSPVVPTSGNKRYSERDDVKPDLATSLRQASNKAQTLPSSHQAYSHETSSGLPVPPLTRPEFALPMYTNELGNLPVYGQFNFSGELRKGPRSEAQYPNIFGPTQPNGHFVINPYPPSTMKPDYTSVVTTGVPTDPQLRQMPDWDFGTYGLPDAGMQVLSNTEQPKVEGVPMMDSDVLAMWLSAPSGFQLDDWGTYLASVNQMAHPNEVNM